MIHHCQHHDKFQNLLLRKKTLTCRRGYQHNHAIEPQEGSIACFTVDLETNVNDHRNIRDKHLSLDDLHLNACRYNQLTQHFFGK